MPPLPSIPPDLAWPLLAAVLAVGLFVGLLLGGRAHGRTTRVAVTERDEARRELDLVRESIADSRAQLAAARAVAERVPALEDKLLAAERSSAQAERVPAMEHELALLRGRVEALASAKTKLEEALRRTEEAHAEKVALLSALREDVEARMKALADAALRESQTSLIEVAKQLLDSHKQVAEADLAARQGAIDGLVKPVAETLEKYQQRLAALEQDSARQMGALSAELRNVVTGQESVRSEAARLVNALRAAPKTRGRWGEQQLRNAMELAGMSEHVDFDLEHSVASEAGRLRPDAVIRLPGGRHIVIDAKTSLSAYLEALDLVDEAAREAKFAEHARQIKQHATLLAQKDYWSQFEAAPDFVAMFVPGENFYSAALERDPDLFDYAISRRVLIVTPTTLVALAKAVAYGWSQIRATENAREIALLGGELHARLATMVEPIAALGRSLDAATSHYNRFIGSLESRVYPAVRQLRELAPGESPKELPDLKQVETAVRETRRTAESLASPSDS
jgi:DNA recombination protein RmuC